jgi:hypothetical protein
LGDIIGEVEQLLGEGGSGKEAKVEHVGRGGE